MIDPGIQIIFNFVMYSLLALAIGKFIAYRKDKNERPKERSEV